MIEIHLNKIVGWNEVNKIIEKSKHELVLVKMPNSVFNSDKMKYKIELLKKRGVFVEVECKKRGRKKKYDDALKKEILNHLIDGYSIRETAEMVGIPKSTAYDYVKDDIISMKKEQLKELIYEFKEVFIENDLYDIGSVKILFSELEHAVEVGDLNRAYELLSELRYYIE